VHNFLGTLPPVNLPAPKTDFSDPSEYFGFLQGVFQGAADLAGGALDRFYRIGGKLVRLSFAGPALIPKITPAWEHVSAPSGKPASLTLKLWDTASTGVKMPPPPWETQYWNPKGEIPEFCTEDIFTAFMHGHDALNVLNLKSHVGFFWVRNSEHIPYYETSSPLRQLMHVWSRSIGLQMVHGAAVGFKTGGVLLTGKGGLGKSTTALQCLMSGFDFVGEDYILLENHSSPVAHTLYSSAKLNADSLSRFPELAPLIHNKKRRPEEKALALLWPSFSAKMVSSLPIKAILVPFVTNQASTYCEPISTVECLKALAPSTLAQLPGADPRTFFGLSALAKKLPAYRLYLGNELRKIPQCISDLLLTL